MDSRKVKILIASSNLALTAKLYPKGKSTGKKFILSNSIPKVEQPIYGIGIFAL